VISIYRRDLMSYFYSSLAWIISAVYLFILGLIYYAMVTNFSEQSMMASMGQAESSVNVMSQLVVPYVWWMGFLMMFILPMLTMRLIAEERRTGTLEMLFTYPLTEFQIVMGKFLAAMSVVAFMLLASFFSILSLSRYVSIDWHLIASGYVGLLLLGGCFVVFGIWTSSLTSSQMVAGVLTYGGLMTMWLVQAVVDKNFPVFKEKLGGLSMMEHLENMARGNLHSQDFVYYILWIVLFLFLTTRVLESRKWSS
jgi:ABC-2 type transport system permease protein